MKDSLYAISLVVSLAAGSAAILLGLAALFTSSGEPSKGGAHPSAPKAFRFVRLATALVTLSGVGGLTSLVVHWHWEHGPNAVVPMTAIELVRAHPSFLLAALLVAVGTALALAANARIATPHA